MKVTVNLKVDAAMNEERKKLKATWRDVLVAGLAALGSSKGSLESKPPSLDPTIEENLKQAVLHLQNAWKGIKATK